MKQVYHLIDQTRKQNALQFIQQLPTDTKKPLVVTVEERKRTLPQNKKMWPLLKDLSQQVTWYGEKYDEADWKDLITALVAKTKKQEQRTAPGIGGGVVMFGERTSKMKVSQMVEVIEAIYWFGTEQGVTFSDESRIEIEWANRFGDKTHDNTKNNQ